MEKKKKERQFTNWGGIAFSYKTEVHSKEIKRGNCFYRKSSSTGSHSDLFIQTKDVSLFSPDWLVVGTVD